jgi:hypothetical protein
MQKKMKQLMLILASLSSTVAICQSPEQHEDLVGSDFAFASYRGSLSFQWVRNWNIGKQGKWWIGAGARATAFLGANQYYRTAPAELTSGKQGLLVIFTDNIIENIDSVLVKSPQVTALNAFVNIAYRFDSHWRVGFDIDVVGFSLGATQRGNYINGFAGANTTARPSSFNLLLTSDNDLGSLNSEMYVSYQITPRWAVKAAAQFLFTEYKTATAVQTSPRENDRFRNKSLMAAFGATFKL